MQGPQFLSGEQILLTTLLVKLAVVAALATMLARYHRFRHILIFERRALARPAGLRLQPRHSADGRRRRAAAPQLQRRRPDARGRVSRRPHRRPVRRRHRRRDGRGAAARQRRVGRAAVRGRLRIRGRRPPRAVPEGSDLALLAVRVHRASPPRLAHAADHGRGLAGRAAARAGRAGAAAAGPGTALEPPPVLAARRASGVGADAAAGAAGHRAGGGDADQDLEQRRASSTGCRNRKSCCSRPRSRRWPTRSTRTSCSTR